MIVDDPSTFRRGVLVPPAASTAPGAAAAAAAIETGPMPPAKISHAAAVLDRNPSKSCISAPAEEPPNGAGVDAATGPEPDSTSSSSAESATPIEAANPEAHDPNGKRKADGMGDDRGSLPQRKSRAKVDRTRGRMRLTLGQKLEILQLLGEKKMTRLEIARIYKCSDRTVSSCFANRATLEVEAGSAARKLKSKGRRAVGFPEVRAFRVSHICAGVCPTPAAVLLVLYMIMYSQLSLII